MGEEILEQPLPEFGELKATAKLGTGSFGETFRAVDSANIGYAIKWLRSDADRNARLRFENEKWALQQLDHPRIPKFISEGQSLSRPYFVMSLARGGSLRKLLAAQETGGGANQMDVLSIMEAVLDALTYAHSKQILHRDVKDDNIVATPSMSHVTLIDWGFCKGPGQPADVSSFWNVGAARYSPPDKLRHPSEAHPTHDVFAIGVVGYLLLTNRYPWDVGPSEDFGHLAERMLRERSVPVSSLNYSVSNEVSQFLSRLLVLNDDRRLCAEEARDECRTLQTQVSRELSAPAITKERRVIFPRVIRDPIHGDIRMTEFEWQILDSREFQRLRGIHQLGFANFVYPGAEHSRLSHSLGTMFVADRILRYIEDVTGVAFPVEERLMARAYSLVHDVTHICYGHTLEDELEIFPRHDMNNRRLDRLVFSEKSALGAVLKSTDYGRELLSYLDPSSSAYQHAHIKELVESPSGPDVLDYIDRDSYFCGLDHRVDSAIYRHYRVVSDTEGVSDSHIAPRLYGTHGVRLDADFALESVFLERFALFMKVYTHSTKVGAGAMLGKAIALESAGKPGQGIDERAIEWMSDVALLESLGRSKRQEVRKIAKALQSRQLFKPAFRATALSQVERTVDQYEARLAQFRDRKLLGAAGRSLAEGQLSKEVKAERAEVVFYCLSSAPGLQKLRQYVEHKPGSVELRDEVYQPYLLTQQRHLRLWTVYVFTSLQVKDPKFAKLGEAAEDLLGLKNQVSVDRRQGLLFS